MVGGRVSGTEKVYHFFRRDESLGRREAHVMMSACPALASHRACLCTAHLCPTAEAGDASRFEETSPLDPFLHSTIIGTTYGA